MTIHPFLFGARINRREPQILTSKSEVKSMKKNAQNRPAPAPEQELTNAVPSRKKGKAAGQNLTEPSVSDCK